MTFIVNYKMIIIEKIIRQLKQDYYKKTKAILFILQCCMN